MALYIFSILISLVACVLCTGEALLSWSEGKDMNWLMLILGITNGFLCLMNVYFFARDFLI